MTHSNGHRLSPLQTTSVLFGTFVGLLGLVTLVFALLTGVWVVFASVLAFGVIAGCTVLALAFVEWLDQR